MDEDLLKVLDTIERVRDVIEEVKSEVQERLDDMPEELQDSVEASEMQCYIDSLCCAYTCLEDAEDFIFDTTQYKI